MCGSSCVFTVVECIRTSISCTFVTSPGLLDFFAEAEEKGFVSFLLSACFFMIQCIREKSSVKYPLSSTEVYSDQCCCSM